MGMMVLSWNILAIAFMPGNLAAEAAALLGAAVSITNISRGMAQALVELDVQLGRTGTMGDLQSGIEAAFRLLHD